MKFLKKIKAAIETFKEPSKTPINAYYVKEKIVEKVKTITKTAKGPSKRVIKKRLNDLEKAVKAGPGGENGKMGGSCMVNENGKVKIIDFKTKKDALDVIQKVRDGELELMI